jgi:hypothetical protein
MFGLLKIRMFMQSVAADHPYISCKHTNGIITYYFLKCNTFFVFF